MCETSSTFIFKQSSFGVPNADGARWLTRKRPEVRLIGIDYLTIATYADLKGPHEELLDKVQWHSLPLCSSQEEQNSSVCQGSYIGKDPDEELFLDKVHQVFIL